MEELTIQYPWYLKLLSPILNLKLTVSFNSKNIIITDNKNNEAIFLESLKRDSHLIKGMFGFHNVTISNHRNEKLEFRFLNSNDANMISEKIKQSVEYWHKQVYSDSIEKISSSNKLISNFLNTKVYIKKSQFSKFIDNFNWPSIPKIHYPDLVEAHLKSEIEKHVKFRDNKHRYLDTANRRFIENEISKYQYLLSDLNPSQAKASVINDDNNLVIAGAGTGKTKTMISRLSYLLSSNNHSAKEILLLAFGKDARKEMEDRAKGISKEKLNVSTFHSLGLSIIKSVEGKSRGISSLALDDAKRKKFIDDIFQDKLNKDDHYKKLVLAYFNEHMFPYRNPFDFNSLGEYYDYLKANEIRALNTDKVKSYEEVIIANFLFTNNINFEYERRYPLQTSSVGFTSYKPDFYLSDYDIYIEHFGVNRNMQAPAYMNPRKYSSDMEKKRQLHATNSTTLIESYSYQKREGTLLDLLKEKLIDKGVLFEPMPVDLHLEKLKDFGAITKFSSLMNDILKCVKIMNHSIDNLQDIARNANDSGMASSAVELYIPIHISYDQALKSANEMDFDEMINTAATYVSSGQFNSPFKAILIDEYQDLSPPRASLIKALREQHEDSTLFCVGDDWQGIYRFTGADLSFTFDFFNHFGEGTSAYLDTTYRFNNSICDVATEFVQQNPQQIKKNITTLDKVDAPAVCITRTVESEQEEQITKILDFVHQKYGNCSVLLLNRFKFKKPTYLYKLQQQYRSMGVSIKFMSSHASKGKESDIVILMDVLKGKHGFPSEKITHPFLEMLLPTKETFGHAEERRLFYVSLTRAKKAVFIISLEDCPSPFISELRKQNSPISEEAIAPSSKVKLISNDCCPQCKTGLLITRGNGSFQGCSNYPLCEYTFNNCQRCKSPRTKKNGYYICKSNTCDWSDPICPSCDGALVTRKGERGAFWGCSNFPSCRQTANLNEYQFKPKFT